MGKNGKKNKNSPNQKNKKKAGQNQPKIKDSLKNGKPKQQLSKDTNAQNEGNPPATDKNTARTEEKNEKEGRHSTETPPGSKSVTLADNEEKNNGEQQKKIRKIVKRKLEL